ncbi:MAG: hypothetical protein ACRCYE_01195 [Sarcina sp.]
MSRKKHREKRKDMNYDNNIGVNPNIMELLQGSNLDINKINTLISAMNQDGFDINSLASLLNNGAINNLPNSNNMGFDMSTINNMLNNLDNYNNNFKGNTNYQNENYQNINNFKNIDSDENIEMLQAIKSVVNPKKAKFLDRVIEMYKRGEIKY